MHFEQSADSSTNGAIDTSPGQRPGCAQKQTRALKGRDRKVPPRWGFILLSSKTQGAALGWYISGPLALCVARIAKMHNTLSTTNSPRGSDPEHLRRISE